MIMQLDVPFTDTGVSQLSYVPDAPPLPVLGELSDPGLVPGGHLSLRLLGASHQAVLTLPDGWYAETVACLDTGGDALPTRRVIQVGDWTCRLRTWIEHLPPTAVAADARRMRRCAERDDPRRTLYARFPGHPLAATFLRILPGPAPAWHTVHVYPERGEQVSTRTDVRPVRGTTAALTGSLTRLPRTREKI